MKDGHYQSFDSFKSDADQMFQNFYIYNPINTELLTYVNKISNYFNNLSDSNENDEKLFNQPSSNDDEPMHTIGRFKDYYINNFIQNISNCDDTELKSDHSYSNNESFNDNDNELKNKSDMFNDNDDNSNNSNRTFDDNDNDLENDSDTSDDNDDNSNNNNRTFDGNDLDIIFDSSKTTKNGITNLKSIKMNIEKYIFSENNQAPKIFLNDDCYLTRTYDINTSTRTYNTIRDRGALGYVTSYLDGSHRMYQCSVLHYNNADYQCKICKRAKDLESVVEYNIHKFDVEHLKQTTLNVQKTPLVTKKKGVLDPIIDSLSYLVACENFSLNRISCDAIRSLIIESIEIGQRAPNVPPDQLVPHISKSTIRSRILDLAHSFGEKSSNSILLFLIKVL